MHPTDLAVEDYHDLLRQSDVAALWQGFQDAMRANLLAFGDRPICNVLRPHFLHPAEYERIAAATALVVSAIHKIYAALRQGELDMAGLLHLSPAEAALVQLPDSYGRPDVSARMDAFWLRGDRIGAGDLHFLEYNADSPGGLGYGDALSALFLEFEPMRRFQESYRVQSYPVRRRVYTTLVETYRDWCAAAGKIPVQRPNIAIVDWRTVRTRNEFILSTQIFEEMGSAVRICDPDELSLREGRLWIGADFPIDIVYKRVVVNELINRYPNADDLLAHPLVQAVAQGSVCMANHFNCQILYNKVIFALISDEENAHRFDRDEEETIRQSVPWTRLVSDRRTRYADREIDLIAFIRSHKDALVLKPIREYGGTGVVLGWEVDEDAWQAATTTALATPHIVQKRAPIPCESFPIWQDGALHFAPRLFDVDPYVWRGEQIAHAGVRLGTSSLLNVSAGGGSAVPLFMVEKRS
ncbi:MAG: circularly permuted type 2 ATP-grasp protein [Caldilineaceae bacterium]|nr:circularly permuted type 2 ATP-grasp protein [Caldilineaceae bacterium]